MTPDAAAFVSPEQIDIVAFLSSPAAYQGVEPVRIDTHLSHVFLAGDFVFKLKRAVRLDFVDYSTPKKRLEYCRREIEANAAWSGDLYLGVIPVTRSGAEYQIDGRGQVVDWLVKMNRFCDGDRLDQAIGSGRTNDVEIRSLADDLAERHLASGSNHELGGMDGILDLAAQIGGDLISHPVNSIKDASIREWQSGLRSKIFAQRDWYAARRKDGKIKLCHGDLHLKNLCYWNDRIIGFDALEFDEEMRTIDVFYDLAFLIMDLIRHGQNRFACLLLARYLARTGDYDGLTGLEIFLSLRAGVRAMANAIAGNEAETAVYFGLARQFLCDRSRPQAVLIGGRSGTGKTTIATDLAAGFGKSPGAIVVRSDVIRKLLGGSSPEAAMTPASYTELSAAKVYSAMRDAAMQILRRGYSCVLDATFLNQEERRRTKSALQDIGIEPICLWLTAPTEVLKSRLEHRTGDASDADIGVLKTQLKKADPETWVQVSAVGSPEAVTRAVIGQINQGHAHSYTIHDHNPAHDV